VQAITETVWIAFCAVCLSIPVAFVAGMVYCTAGIFALKMARLLGEPRRGFVYSIVATVVAADILTLILSLSYFSRKL
jgi:hypothetical protein